MNHFYSVKEEQVGSSGNRQVAVPEPITGLDENGPPPFLTKIYEMVEDPSTDNVISWNRDGKSFVVWDVYAFSVHFLPKYFKHGNFSSFIRQLNTYGFRKIDPGIWEFANEYFMKDHKDLLKNIKRKRASHHQESHHEIARFELNKELEELLRDKKKLFMELMNLKQQQQMNMVQIQEMEARLQGTEKNQERMMSFFAKVFENPCFINQLVHGGKLINGFEFNETSRKRRRLINSHGFQVSELEALALEMQGNVAESDEEVEGEFWKEMKDEGFDEELSLMLSNMPSFLE